MIFGLDFGLKRIGLARLVNGIVLPMPAIMRKGRRQASQALEGILKSSLGGENLELVIGITPESEVPSFDMRKRVEHFLGLTRLSGQVIFIDESFSSIEAEERLALRGYEARRRGRKDGSIDSLSACILLERYLEGSSFESMHLSHGRLVSPSSSLSLDSKGLLDSATSPALASKNLEHPRATKSPAAHDAIESKFPQNPINSPINQSAAKDKNPPMQASFDSKAAQACPIALPSHLIHAKARNSKIQGACNANATISPQNLGSLQSSITPQGTESKEEKRPHIPVLLNEVVATFKSALLDLEGQIQSPLQAGQNVDSKSHQLALEKSQGLRAIDHTASFASGAQIQSTDPTSRDAIESPLQNPSPQGLDNQENSISSFIAKSKACIIDCTLGFGGLSGALLESYEGLSIIGIDRDSDALAYSRHLEARFRGRVMFLLGDFASYLPRLLGEFLAHPGKLRGVLADLGVSSPQLDRLDRGFSFSSPALDMRMDRRQSLDAMKVLQSYSAYDLERIFRNYGEIKPARRLANLIVEARREGRLSASTLRDIASRIPSRGGMHPSTLIYQALRLEVNDELGQLAGLLKACEGLSAATLCIISFHSLEDRLVKRALKAWAMDCVCDLGAPKCLCGGGKSRGRILYKKPLSASSAELKANPRSRSAKLRAFEFR